MKCLSHQDPFRISHILTYWISGLSFGLQSFEYWDYSFPLRRVEHFPPSLLSQECVSHRGDKWVVQVHLACSPCSDLTPAIFFSTIIFPSPFLSLWVTRQLTVLWIGRFGQSDCQKYFYRVKGHLWNAMASLPPAPPRMWHWILGSCHCPQHTKVSSWPHRTLQSIYIISSPHISKCIDFHVLP